MGAKVVLLKNVATSLGLVNGATGVIKDFLFVPGTKAPQLPYAIIINFRQYKGPPFFSGEDKKTWVPLLAETSEWEGKHFRKGFPLTLAWAMTAWKSQGLTVKSPTKLYLQLGEKEAESGATYVAFSRVEDHKQICLGTGVTLERLTTKISSHAKSLPRIEADRRLNELAEETKNLLPYVF